MASLPEYDRLDATALADLVRRKQVRPAGLVEAAIERIEASNPRLNAVVFKLYDRGRQQAAGPLPDGPFSGVPFLLKDLLAADAGTCTTNGCRFFAGYSPPRDSELVRRFKAAGLLIVGKTNTPEMGILPVTEPRLYGPTRNPWNTAHTPGGSSGGAASAVAAGMVPMAHGGDGGGSLRIPASCCGLFGLKPTRARNPLGPYVGEGWHGIVVEHAVTRSLRDSAGLLAQIGRKFRAAELSLAVHRVRAAGRELAVWFEEHDALLTPTLAAPPLPIGALDQKPAEKLALLVLRALPSELLLRKLLDQLAEQAFEYAAFTPIANLTGQPAMSVPLFWNGPGLPIGCHFLGRFGDEATLLRLAGQLERAQPWADRRPPSFALSGGAG